MVSESASLLSLCTFRGLPILVVFMLAGTATVPGGLTAAETVSVQVTDSTATEGPASDVGIILIKRAVATTSPLTVYLTSSGAATKGVDYGEPPSSVIIPANATSVAVSIFPIDDAVAEVSETVILTIAANAAYIIGSPNSGTVNLRDDEPTEISFSASDNSASEASGNTGTFTVTRKGRASEALYVPLSYDGTAVAGVDYPVASSMGYFAPFSATRTITITPTDDTLAEPDETIRATVSAGSTYRLVGSTTATITVADNEAAILTVVPSDATASETGGNTGAFRIDRIGNKATALSIPYTLGGSASAGADFTALSGTASLGANQSSVTITVSPLDDSVVEGTETIQMTLLSGSGYTLGTTVSALVSLTENEQAVSISATDRAAQEPGTTDKGQFTIARSSTSISAALSISYTVSGSANAGSDYTALTGTVSIAANATTATITVNPLDDTLAEGVETVVVTLTPSAAFGIVGSGTATVEVGDNESASSVMTVYGPGNTPEIPTGGYYVTFNRAAPYAGALTIYYTVTGTAIAGGDYVAFPGSITIPNNTSYAQLPVTTIDDSLSEAEETITVTLLAGGNYTLGATPSATVSITDDDAVLVSVSASDATASEPARSDGNAVFTVSRTGSLTNAVTIPFSVGGSAIHGIDYATVAMTSVTIPSAVASATLTITPINDTLSEPAETVVMTIESGSGYVIAGATSASATIQDDDPTVVTITASDPSATEGGDTGAFVIARTGLANTALSIPMTLSGTASSTADFTALPTSVSLAANTASTTVTVTTVNDSLQEGPETVIATLGTGGNYTLGSPTTATVTITDDEPSVSAQVIDLYAREGGTPGAVAIVRTGSLTSALTVNLESTGSAIVGTHITALPTSVTIAANSAVTVVPVTAINDGTWRAETLVQIGITPGAYKISQPSSGMVIVMDNDNGPPSVVVRMQTPAQSSTTLTLDASATSDPNGDPLTYRWSIYGAGVLSTTAQLAYDFKLLAGQIIELVVSDGKYSVQNYYPVVYVNAATTIAAGDSANDNGVLLVDGATLTLDGAHSYLVARVINAGTITHSPCTSTSLSSLALTVAQQLFIDATSKINVTGRGLPKGMAFTSQGPQFIGTTYGYSGGSHGGYGHKHGGADTPSDVYGAFENPSEVGSGGGSYSPAAGNAGGGLVRLSAGTLHLNGQIVANGQDGTTGGGSYGGGAGGGISVTVTTIAGSGSLMAQGGACYGPGGGGRVALRYTTGTWTPAQTSAAGGYLGDRSVSSSSYPFGGAGTVYLFQVVQPAGTVLIDNKFTVNPPTSLARPRTPWYFGSRLTTWDDPATFSGIIKVAGWADALVDATPTAVTWKTGSVVDLGRLEAPSVSGESWSITNQGEVITRQVTVTSLSLTNNAVLRSFATTASAFESLTLSAATSISIDATSSIDVTARGCPKGYRWSSTGPVAQDFSMLHSSGSYGGYGVAHSTADLPSEVYGAFDNPNEVGSGGGRNVSGSAGGGLIRLTANALMNNGTIRANGQDASTGSDGYYAGASGGGINVLVSDYAGTGVIETRGGNQMGSPGGGGRVAIVHTTGTVDVTKLSAAGGYADRAAPQASWGIGGAGTVYVKKSGQTTATLVFDNRFTTLPTTWASAKKTPWYFGARGVGGDDPASFSGPIKVVGGASILLEPTTTAITWKSGSQIDRSRVELLADITAEVWALTNGAIVLANRVSAPGVSATMTGSSILEASQVIAGSLSVTNSSRLSSLPSTTTLAAKLEVTVSGTVTIDATSTIDVTARGCPKGYRWSASGPVAQESAMLHASGSYAGYGVDHGSPGTPDKANEPYGSYFDPNETGSGGGKNPMGGAGGGLVRLSANALVLNGTIKANGQDHLTGADTYYSSGSGGGIRLSVSSFSGTGTIRADGGGGINSPGGGGRIAIYHASGSIDFAKVSAYGGYHNRASPQATYAKAGAGTLFVQKTGDRYGTLRFDNGGVDQARPSLLFVGTPYANNGTQPVPPVDVLVQALNGGAYVLNGDLYAFDSDRDGLTSWEEQSAGTDPRDSDSNDNGLSDGAELRLGQLPLVLDTDGDGVSNATELAQGSDPFRSDTDGDGVADGLDVFPTDRLQSSWPAPSPTDTTPPVISITSPSGVVKL